MTEESQLPVGGEARIGRERQNTNSQQTGKHRLAMELLLERDAQGQPAERHVHGRAPIAGIGSAVSVERPSGAL